MTANLRTVEDSALSDHSCDIPYVLPIVECGHCPLQAAGRALLTLHISCAPWLVAFRLSPNIEALKLDRRAGGTRTKYHGRL